MSTKTDFKKSKNKVLKKYPDAKCFLKAGKYVICDKDGYPISPPAKNVSDAWINFATVLWTKNVITKSFKSDTEKIFKSLAKEPVVKKSSNKLLKYYEET